MVRPVMTVSESVSPPDMQGTAEAHGAGGGGHGRQGRTAELRRVLCVDDDADIRAITDLALGMIGKLDVTLCESGEACLLELERDLPDLVVLDVNMPGLDGLETLRLIRCNPRTAGLPVVMLTARMVQHDVDSYHAAGATGVIGKPFDPMDLASRLHVYHDGHIRSLGLSATATGR